MSLKITNLTKKFDNKIIFKNFSYEFKENGIYVLSGDSGKGKTTLLRIIAGLDKRYDGYVTNVSVSYAFQEYRLFPVLTALENITKILWQTPSEDQVNAAKNMLRYFGFTDSDLKLYPRELSGGMKQRVSLSRAFLASKNVILLDEPFKELDNNLRYKLRELLKEYSKDSLIILTAHTPEMTQNLNKEVLVLE